MNRRILVTACCFAPLLAAPAFAASRLLENIPLKWSPRTSLSQMGPLDISGPLLGLKVHVEPFTDSRPQPALIAENREKKDPRPVTTADNVAEFVTVHVAGAMSTAGLSLVDGNADFTVSGEIRQFFVTETHQYLGEMSVLVRVRNAAGAEVWTGIVSGSAENFGRSYKPDNYYETMSDMILHTGYNLLTNPGLRSALQRR
jgi:hypothetical protein